MSSLNSPNIILFRQLLRFAVVGVANTFLGLAVIYGLMYAGVDPLLANALGYVVGFGVSFTLNRSWTFATINTRSGTFWRFLALAIIAYAANFILVAIGTRVLAVNPYLAQATGIVVYTGVTFVGSKLYVFADKATVRPPQTPG